MAIADKNKPKLYVEDIIITISQPYCIWLIRLKTNINTVKILIINSFHKINDNWNQNSGSIVCKLLMDLMSITLVIARVYVFICSPKFRNYV